MNAAVTTPPEPKIFLDGVQVGGSPLVELETLAAAQKSPINIPGASRWEYLPDLFARLGFTSGAEIGVEQGKYAKQLCSRIPGLRLLAVDPWLAYHGYREHVSQEKLDWFYADTTRRLAPYGVQIVRATSAQASAAVKDGSLDFVFIDANHTFEHVVADLAAWEPKVRRGGIVAGHDYRRIKGKAGAIFGVVDAVNGWTRTHDVAPWFLTRGDNSPSFFWVKP